MLFTLICLPFYQQIVLKMFFCLLLFFLYSFYLLIKILILGEHRPVSEMGELTVAQSIIATGGFRFRDSPGLCRVLLPNEVVQAPLDQSTARKMLDGNHRRAVLGPHWYVMLFIHFFKHATQCSVLTFQKATTDILYIFFLGPSIRICMASFQPAQR